MCKLQEAKTCDDLIKFFKQKEVHHTYYYHYTTLKALNCILENNTLLLSCVEDFNDTIDASQFSEEYKKYYSFCFSTGTSENLPLWYLYSGVDGNGARIRFTKKGMLKLFEPRRITLVEWDNEKKEVSGTVKEGMKVDIDFKLECKDIVYSDNSKSSGRIKYNNHVNNIIPKLELEKFIKENNGFNKGLVWFYEKETRILITLSDEIYEKLENDKTYKLSWQFDDLTKYMRVTLAPNDKQKNILKDIEGYEYIKSFMMNSSSIDLSEYDGTVKFGICSKCEIYSNHDHLL